jgi:uncharacterized protein (DUF2141 family)
MHLYSRTISTKQKLILLVLFPLSSFYSDAQTGTVILEIRGIQVAKGGEIAGAIFIKQHFLNTGKETMSGSMAVSASQMQLVFEHVPVGVYAMVAFQDIDRNKKLKTNLIGYPKEPFGFSRDAKLKFGPPDFDDAKVEVTNGKTVRVTITLK